LIFNKLYRDCLFYTAPLHFGLASQLGLMGPETKGVRMHINGAYWRYMLYIDRPGEDSVKDWLDHLNKQCPNKPTLRVGHLFKAQGVSPDQGPWFVTFLYIYSYL
jgi:hypothetical protein